MTARAMLSWLLKAMNPGVGQAGVVPGVPFFAAWPGAPVCWARGIDFRRQP